MPKRANANQKPPRTRNYPFIVGITNDLAEFAAVRCFASSPQLAEETVSELLNRGELSHLEYNRGDDHEGPSTCSVQKDPGDHFWVDTNIKDGKVIPTRFKLRCPFCKYDGKAESEHGGTFRYLSAQTTYRDVNRLVRARTGTPAKLIVEAHSEIYDEDPESNERLECRKCLKEFPVPKSLQVSFV